MIGYPHQKSQGYSFSKYSKSLFYHSGLIMQYRTNDRKTLKQHLTMRAETVSS